MQSESKCKPSLILLLSFVAAGLAITIACIIILPLVVVRERHCDRLDAYNHDVLELKAASGSELKIHLNQNKTIKRNGKYFHCPDTHDGLIHEHHQDVSCSRFEWRVQSYIPSVTDCIEFGSQHWFGGSILWNQKWPLNGNQQGEAPYVPGDIYQLEYGGVMERFWISSGGFSIFVEDSVPLLVQLLKDRICLSGSQQANSRHYNLAVRNYSEPLLAYTVCSGPDIKTLYQNLHLWQRPQQTPARDLFAQPIWSTWAYLKQNITTESVLEFSRNVSSRGLACSQIEIDDKWSTNYGDHIFDSARFPDVQQLVSSIHDLGFNVTLWVHPFVNSDSTAFTFGAQQMQQNKTYLVAEAASRQRPAITSWWRGQNSSLIDVTDPRSQGATELAGKLQALLDLGVDSFKFDGGEANWIPRNVSFAKNRVNPGWYTFAWSQFSYEMDKDSRRQETRIGFRAQHLPIIVRTMDKDSRWGLDNGLSAVVTSALTHSIIGYNFFLPDMIGGNAYCDDTGLEGKCFPDEELYIRWLQLSAFMPSLQFSVPPWIYSEEVVQLTRQLLAARSEHRFKENMDKALRDSLSNIPIVRPIWWRTNDNFEIDDQYLLGDSILVAPVLREGQTERSVYFPQGTWRHWSPSANASDITGPKVVQYSVPIHQVAAFYLVNE